MVVLRIFKHKPILSPLCQFELDGWTALGLCHVKVPIRRLSIRRNSKETVRPPATVLESPSIIPPAG
jgi:hypothetical protein